jgi:hypothetical protein
LLFSAGVLPVDLLLFSSSVAVFVAYTHRSNLQKIARGQGTPDIAFNLFGRSRQT